MRPLSLLCATLMLAACGGSENREAAGAPDSASAVPGLTAADLAGTWNMKATTITGDSTLVEYTMTATADPSGWTVTFPDRDPMPVKVESLSQDSIVTVIGPYESVLRQGVMVTTRSVSMLMGNQLAGTFTAHYQNAGADSLLQGRSSGTRATPE